MSDGRCGASRTAARQAFLERLGNFTRVETFGKSAANGHNGVHWLKVTVDVRSRDAFSYEPMKVPGNRTAVPSPSR